MSKKPDSKVFNEGMDMGQFLGNINTGVALSQTDTLFKNNRWYLVSNLRQLLSQAYAEHGLIQTVVDVPVDDAFRGGVEIKTEQLEAAQLQQLQAEIERQGDLVTVAQTCKWNRLYGGAATIVITDQDPDTPIDMDSITKDSNLQFKAVDMWELFWDKQETETIDLQTHELEHYSYYGHKLHKSRVFKMKGLVAPSFIRPRLRGWGLSIVEPIVRSINQYLKSNDLIFEVLDEFKLDIFKIKNLTSTLLSPGGKEKVRNRVADANATKNYLNALTMDADDDYIQKQLSFAGISETMVGIRMQIASDLRMPLTKIFGISAAGFSSGQDDIENYNAMVEGQVRAKCKADITKIIELRCQQLFEFIPDDIQIEFSSLRILSTEQEENVKAQKFARLTQALQLGVMTTKEFKQACNKENLLEIPLDIDIEKIEDPSLDQASVDNSRDFDLASYQADGGDSWIHPKREQFFTNPTGVDKQLWDKARQKSREIFGLEKWQFIAWFYRKLGGHHT